MLLDPGSGCASPLSIDSVAFGVVTWSTSRISMVQVGQTVLDHYIMGAIASNVSCFVATETNHFPDIVLGPFWIGHCLPPSISSR